MLLKAAKLRRFELRSSAPCDDLPCRISDDATIFTAARNSLQRRLQDCKLIGIEGLPRIFVIPPSAKVRQVQFSHVGRRLFQKASLAFHHTPTRSSQFAIQNGAHVERLPMMPLQLSEKPVVEAQGRVTRIQRFRLVNHQPSSWGRDSLPRRKDFPQGTKMR